MADFCRACSIAMFNEDFGDLAGLCKDDEKARALCENCGEIWVDSKGARIASANPPAEKQLSPQEQFDAAEAMIRDNLATACAELLELGSACILKDGVIRKAAALITCLPPGGHLKTVENTVRDLALRFVVNVANARKH